MVRTRASIATSEREVVPPVVAGRGRAWGRAKTPARGRTVATRGGAPTRVRGHTRVVSIESPAD